MFFLIKMRYQSVDILRWIAVVLMVFFHFYFMSSAFFGWEIFADYAQVLFWIGRSAAVLFLLVSGLIFWLSYQKKTFSLKKYYQRAWQIFFAAFLVTLGSYLFSPERTVWFGILHFFALSFVLLPMVARLSIWWTGIVGFLCFGIGNYLASRTFAVSLWLLPLGLKSPSFQSFDYYPLFPRFGYVLIGYLIALFLKNNNLVEKLLGWYYPKLVLLSRTGRRSLVVYLVHIPLVYGLLLLVS